MEEELEFLRTLLSDKLRMITASKKFNSYTSSFQQQLAFTQAVRTVGELHQSFLGL